jgi:SAM-dependent methyltransferase
MNNFEELKSCLCCNNNELDLVLDLGQQPLANSYHNGENLEYYPLILNLCKECWHLQLGHVVNPDLMFKNYLYVSGTSNTGKEYFKWFSNFTLSQQPNAKNVLDIASNDGTQLDYYKDLGLNTFGIDPAKNLSKIAESKGHKIITDYFNQDTLVKFDDIKFDIIVAQNVFAHNGYPLDFLKSCKNLLSEDGRIYIQTSQSNMIINNEFDTIYHEHISFFSVMSMIEIVKKSGLFLNDVFKTDIHGVSNVFVLSKRDFTNDSVVKEINNFKSNSLDKIQKYVDYSLNSYKIVKELKKVIIEYKNNGHQIVGYGAAAKGNTLLNFGKINLDYILDDNELKWGLMTPGMNIKIEPPKHLLNIKKDEPIIFIPLSWNFYDEIKNKIKNIRDNDNDIFVKYFPQIKIER